MDIIIFCFSGNTLVCFSPRAGVSVQWVHKSKVAKLCQPPYEFTGEEEQIVWIKSPSCPVNCPKTCLIFIFIAFWFGASAAAVVVAASDSDGTGRGECETWVEGSGAEEAKSKEEESIGGLCTAFDWTPRCFLETDLRKDVGTNDH